jgi:protocatechuate 3,4-dioxygenase beta subunit
MRTKGEPSMQFAKSFPGRRKFLGVAATGFFFARGLFAERLAATPGLTEGPYYPDRLPLDTDNDLLILGDRLTPATGQITRLTGRVLTAAGSPVNGASIEIWQADNNGVYINSRSPNKERQDRNFQGFGQFTTASDGRYAFRTIKPVPYEGRCPHIHVKVKKGDKELITTQVFVYGHPMNAQDGVLGELRDPVDRELVVVDFKAVPDSVLGELTAKFDIVLGLTPEERALRPRGALSDRVGQIAGL